MLRIITESINMGSICLEIPARYSRMTFPNVNLCIA